MLSLVHMPAGRNPPFPALWHWKRFNPFPFKHTRASPPPSGKPQPPPAPAAAARTAEYENPPTNPYVPPNPFVGADAYIGPRSMHRFYGNLRRMRNCPTGRCGHRPLHPPAPNFRALRVQNPLRAEGKCGMIQKSGHVCHPPDEGALLPGAKRP